MVIDFPPILLVLLSPDQHCTYFPDTLYMTLLAAFESAFLLFRCLLYRTLVNPALHRISSPFFFGRPRQTRWLVSEGCWSSIGQKMPRDIKGCRKVALAGKTIERMYRSVHTIQVKRGTDNHVIAKTFVPSASGMDADVPLYTVVLKCILRNFKSLEYESVSAFILPADHE
jgi:hypothetical protein